MSSAGALSNLVLATQAVSAIAEVGSGISAMRAANQEADALNTQAALTQAETKRDAAQKRREILSFKESQAMKFNNSGVLLDGSPLLVLQETIDLGNEEIKAITERGNAQSNLFRMRASQMRNRGRSALTGGFAGAAQGTFNTLLQGRQFGLFGNKKASAFTPQKATPLPPVATINPAFGPLPGS